MNARRRPVPGSRSVVAALLVAAFAAACGAEDTDARGPTGSSATGTGAPADEAIAAAELDPAVVRDLRDRVNLRFALADFLKPEPEGDAGHDPYRAPLFYRELGGPDDATHPDDGFGVVTRDASGALHVDPTRPAVYFEVDEVQVGGEPRERTAYAWVHAAPGTTPVAQGVRITHGADGLPAVYETLADSTGLDVLFVSAPVEKAARALHAQVEPERAFAVERPLAAAPDVVVAAQTATGPMALGPFLYLARGTTDVVGLHCRCEPSRVETVRENVEYELRPARELRDLGLLLEWRSQPLAERLRLPRPTD